MSNLNTKIVIYWKFDLEAKLWTFKLCLASTSGMWGGVVGIPFKAVAASLLIRKTYLSLIINFYTHHFFFLILLNIKI